MCISIVGISITTADGSIALVDIVRVADTLGLTGHTRQNVQGQRAADRPGDGVEITTNGGGEDGKEGGEIIGKVVGRTEAEGCGRDGLDAVTVEVAVIGGCIQARARATNLVLVG